jgi:acyl carrier protein
MLPAHRLPALRELVTAGETCDEEIASRWSRERASYNAYGPTETTVCATICSGRAVYGNLIGAPIANACAYVLDGDGGLVPEGVCGEFYVGGAGLARGYHNRPDLTAERFVPDPFAKEPGARMYRTGDLARHRGADGLVFGGRRDQQVKIRGVRIELGEIVSVLSAYPGVREACVDVRRPAGGSERLVAYVVPAQDTPEPGTDALRRFLQQRLPEHMLPAAFVFLPRLPLTENGKIDRAALPDAPQRAPGASAPGSDLERRIAAIWCSLLGLEAVGTQDNFFEVGGDSFSVVRLQERLERELQVNLRLVDLFKFPSVAALAAHIARQGEPSESPAPVRDNRRAEQQKQAQLQGQLRAQQRRSTPHG